MPVGIARRGVTQIRNRKKRGHVGIVHQVMTAETIGFIGIDAAILVMIDNTKFVDALVYLSPQLIRVIV